MRHIQNALRGLALLLLTLSAAAHAATLYDNIGAASGGGDSPAAINFGPLAISFSSGPDPFGLTDVQLLLSGDNTGAGSFSVNLLSDDATNPGTVLTSFGSLSDSSLSFTPGTFSFALGATYSLSANTRYWLQLSATNDSSVNWSYSSDTTGFGVAGEYYANAVVVFDNASNPNSPYQAQINGTTPVPAPAAAWLFASALGGLGVWRGGLIQRQAGRV